MEDEFNEKKSLPVRQEDINNLSHALMLKTARERMGLPQWQKLSDEISHCEYGIYILLVFAYSWSTQR